MSIGRDLLDTYSGYLLYSGGRTTETGLPSLLHGEESHDKITRFLTSELFDEKTLWKKVKKAVRAFGQEEACLIFDDTLIEKPYMDGNEIVTRNYDYKTGGTVKGINLLTAFYNSEKDGQGIRLPIGFRIVAKTGEYTDDTGGEKKRKSPQTKNRMMQEMIRGHLQNQVHSGIYWQIRGIHRRKT